MPALIGACQCSVLQKGDVMHMTTYHYSVIPAEAGIQCS